MAGRAALSSNQGESGAGSGGTELAGGRGVLPHLPLKYEPVEVFLPGIDQSTVDKSTEEWLDTIESKLHYERWYCGHYHTEKQVDKLRFMFEDYALLPHTLSIEEEKALIAKMERRD